MCSYKMTVFLQSLKILNSYLIYIPALALSGLFIWSESTRYFAVLSALLSFILYSIVYGSIVEKIRNTQRSSWTDLLARHFGSYLGFSLILIVPILALSSLYSDLDYLNKSVVEVLIGMSLQCVALYSWPLVFLKRRIFNSIYDGLTFLIQKPWKSTPLILLIFLTSIIKLLATLSTVFIFQSTNIVLVYGIGYLQNIINGYVGLIIFSMATTLLLEDNSPISDVYVQGVIVDPIHS